MKTWILTYILLSSGVHQQTFYDGADCQLHMLELEVITKRDLWTATCQGPKQEYIISSKSRDRAISEASGRERSLMRCDACLYWSAGERCQRATSPAYARKTSGEAYCQKWEQKI